MAALSAPIASAPTALRAVAGVCARAAKTTTTTR